MHNNALHEFPGLNAFGQERPHRPFPVDPQQVEYFMLKFARSPKKPKSGSAGLPLSGTKLAANDQVFLNLPAELKERKTPTSGIIDWDEIFRKIGISRNAPVNQKKP